MMKSGLIKKAGICLAIVSLLCVKPVNAQIPNAGFETWADSSSFAEPAGWATLNELTKSYKVFTCLQGMPGHPGNSYMKLVTQNVPSVGIVPGIVACGTLDSKALPARGFAWSARAKQLKGNYMYEPVGYDNGTILVYLTAWNGKTLKRDTVASGSFLLQETVIPAWGPFSITLNYKNNLQPDSAIIYMAASRSNPHAGTTLSVDSLAFTGTVTGIAPPDQAADNIYIYPNPASDLITVSGLDAGKYYRIFLKDISGKIVMDNGFTASQKNINISASDIATGLYLLEIKSDNGTVVKKLLKN